MEGFMKKHFGEGIGITDLLTLLFITLKLIGEIDWPWNMCDIALFN